jgi:hypothetical protein
MQVMPLRIAAAKGEAAAAAVASLRVETKIKVFHGD